MVRRNHWFGYDGDNWTSHIYMYNNRKQQSCTLLTLCTSEFYFCTFRSRSPSISTTWHNLLFCSCVDDVWAGGQTCIFSFLLLSKPLQQFNPGDEVHRWHAKYLGIIVKLWSQKHKVRFPDDALVVLVVAVVVIDCSVPPMYWVPHMKSRFVLVKIRILFTLWLFLTLNYDF